MKKALFGLSLALNLLLVAAVLWVRAEARETAFGALAAATAAEVRLQQYVLAELESDDPQRVEAVKAFLRRNIDAGDALAANWRDAIDLESFPGGCHWQLACQCGRRRGASLNGSQIATRGENVFSVWQRRGAKPRSPKGSQISARGEAPGDGRLHNPSPVRAPDRLLNRAGARRSAPRLPW